MKKESLLIISGPSGIGKDYLANRLNQNVFSLVLKTTTRNLRQNEKDGREYEFLTVQKYEEASRQSDLFVDDFFLDNYYGIRKSAVKRIWQNSKVPVLLIYSPVIENILKHYPNAICFFLYPDPLEILKERLKKRGDNSLQRFKKAKEEIMIFNNNNLGRFYKIILIKNDNINPVIRKIENCFKYHK